MVYFWSDPDFYLLQKQMRFLGKNKFIDKQGKLPSKMAACSIVSV